MTSLPIRARLFAMMALVYAVWGSWAAVAGKYLSDPPPMGLSLSGAQIGLALSFLPLGAMLAPLISGQLADRWVHAQHLLSLSALLSSGVLLAVSRTSDANQFFWLMLAYSILFSPITSLANTIAFAHLKDPAKEFGPVRAGGTAGWLLGLACLSLWRMVHQAPGDLFVLASLFSLALGVYAIFLPKTPPLGTQIKFPFLQALKLLKNRNFAVFFTFSLILGTMLDFYYVFVSAYIGSPSELGGVGIRPGQVPLIMMLGQASELIVMFTLGRSLAKFGLKRALVFGFGAWALRFALLAISPNLWLVSAALLLHGFSFVLVFGVASLYVNRIATSDVRASAQALVTQGWSGLGRVVGSNVAGLVAAALTVQLSSPLIVRAVQYTKATHWQAFFTVPLIVCLCVAVGMGILFKDPDNSLQVGQLDHNKP